MYFKPFNDKINIIVQANVDFRARHYNSPFRHSVDYRSANATLRHWKIKHLFVF